MVASLTSAVLVGSGESGVEGICLEVDRELERRYMAVRRKTATMAAFRGVSMPVTTTGRRGNRGYGDSRVGCRDGTSFERVCS